MSILILHQDKVHYEVLGRGRPLVFLHGWVGSWRYWIPTMQAASITYRAYALDLWGYGESAKNPSLYALDQQVKLLDGFMQEMGMAKIAILGHGLGAVLALLFAAHYPRCVDRLMLMELPFNLETVHPRLKNQSPAELSEWLLGKVPGGEAALTEATKTDPLALQASLANLSALDVPALLQQIIAPCLLVYGQNDPAVAPPNIPGLPGHLHQVNFEATGHFPMLEEANRFNRLMVDFLALPSGASPHQLQLKEEWKRRVR